MKRSLREPEAKPSASFEQSRRTKSWQDAITALVCILISSLAGANLGFFTGSMLWMLNLERFSALNVILLVLFNPVFWESGSITFCLLIPTGCGFLFALIYRSTIDLSLRSVVMIAGLASHITASVMWYSIWTN